MKAPITHGMPALGTGRAAGELSGSMHPPPPLPSRARAVSRVQGLRVNEAGLLGG